MYGNHFYNETTRRYVAVFGTMFNDIEITRKTGTTTTQQMKVPINYAPMQKILARIDQNLQNNAPAITLPRMSFEMTGMSYAPDRKLTRVTKMVRASASDGSMTSMFAPAPYDIEFQLNIMTKYNEDGTKIIEQILPFFTPDCTVSVKLIDELGTYFDIPIVLNSVSQEDTYEGDFESRRALIWTLNFTMKGYFFGPVSTQKQITFVDADVYPTTDIQSNISYTNLVEGEEYTITNLGSGRNWNAIGADSDPAVGEVFTVNDQLSSHLNTGTGGTATPTTRASGSQITVAPAIPTAVATVSIDPAVAFLLTPGRKYRIYDIGGGDTATGVSAGDMQTAWNKYLTNDDNTGNVYRVGDIFTAPDIVAEANANPSVWSGSKVASTATRLSSASVTPIVTGNIADDSERDSFTQEIGIDDDWKAMVVIQDGDGDNAATSGVAEEHS
jgi:hypothetical protein